MSFEGISFGNGKMKPRTSKSDNEVKKSQLMVHVWHSMLHWYHILILSKLLLYVKFFYQQ